MLMFLTRRIVFYIIPSMLGIIVICFLLLKLVPGDAADALAAQSGSATTEGVEAMRAEMGLDKPVVFQLIDYVSRLTRFDLGYSVRFNTSVTALILDRLPNTLLLMTVSLCLALFVGVIAGWAMALVKGTWIDRTMQVLVLLLYSTPGFWIGLMATVLFAVKLDWLPSSGNMTVGQELSGLAFLLDRARHLVLPTLSLSAFYIAIYAPLMRATMLEVQQQDYMRTAQAKGLHPVTIQLRHAFRNALIPITTVAGLHVSNLLGGAVVIETVFSWPGMGRLAMDAVVGRDFNVLLGILLMSSFVVIVVNILIDLVQAAIDPRIESP